MMSAALPLLPTHTLDRCLGCGGRDLEPLALRYEWRGSFPVVRCRACGLRFLRVQPAPEALGELYSGAYFESDYRCGRSDSAYFSEDAFRDENRGLLDEFARHATPGRMLEVGCAGGWLLKHAIERGWRAEGVELSGEAAAHARALGLEVFHGDLIAAALPDAAFDLAYMGDVLEHVPDCRAVLIEIARVLKHGGVLYLRGPITTHSLARSLALAAWGIAGRTIVLREPPYHVWEFTPGPLARLFDSCGFDVIE
ncbi:MAG: class I SAM-dependent methyltransferase [Candidatus Eisenbacteria bacterium]|nr:class I SAM-dependent methyltransferase [Candidatus Eisenbacteria bacterium]